MTLVNFVNVIIQCYLSEMLIDAQIGAETTDERIKEIWAEYI